MTPHLLSACTKLLNSVDFTLPPHADVRVTDLWGVATALGEIQQIVEWLQRQEGVMPCGHSVDDIVSSNEGTNHCAACEREGKQ